MTIAFLILLAIMAALAAGLYFQVKVSRRQSGEQEQLLKDYQQRVNEQQKLLNDYRALEKNFDNVGEGYDQALLAYEKLEEENNTLKAAMESLEKRCSSLSEQCTRQQEKADKAGAITAQVLDDIRKMASQAGNYPLLALIGKISDLDDIDADAPIERTDNVLLTQIATQAVAVSSIDKSSYLKFDLQVAPDAAATMLSTNEQKAVRALTHLLDNALKFTSDGAVTLKVSVDMDKMLVLYAVEDTGEGIAAEDAERIFEPYVKLNQYFDGLGLGLTIARNIARRLGGDVVLEPVATGTGSRFLLMLPI